MILKALLFRRQRVGEEKEHSWPPREAEAGVLRQEAGVREQLGAEAGYKHPAL